MDCCVCVNGVNYTLSCACNPCGGNCLSMSTNNPNPSIAQNVKGGDGGASCIQNGLNAVGKWGTVLLATLQGKPVATSKSGVAVGARGQNNLPGQTSSTSLLVIVLVIGVVLFVLLKK